MLFRSLDLAVSIDLINKSGAWFAYNGDKIGQGRENAKSYLAEHPEVMEELEKKIREYYDLDRDPSSAAEEEKPEEKKATGRKAKEEA